MSLKIEILEKFHKKEIHSDENLVLKSVVVYPGDRINSIEELALIKNNFHNLALDEKSLSGYFEILNNHSPFSAVMLPNSHILLGFGSGDVNDLSNITYDFNRHQIDVLKGGILTVKSLSNETIVKVNLYKSIED